MPRYRKKPVVIEAMRYDGTNKMAIMDWAATKGTVIDTVPDGDPDKGCHLAIPTLEGTMRGNVGDWIICGVAGEIYPCKADIFQATYEEEGP